MATSEGDKKMHMVRAMSAVKRMGIPQKKAKKVLMNLLDLYDNQWELIEEDGHRALFDAIFEYPDSEEGEHESESQRNNARTEPVRLRSHVRTDHQSSTPVLRPNTVESETSKRPRLEEPISPQTYIRTPPPHAFASEGGTSMRPRSEEHVSPQTHFRESQIVLGADPKPICFKTPKTEPHTDPAPDLPVTLQAPKRDGRIQMDSGFHDSDCSGSSNFAKPKALREPKLENTYDFPQLEFERPIAVIHPGSCSKENDRRSISPRNDSSQPKEALESLATEYSDVSEEVDGVQDAAGKHDRSLELVSIPAEASPSAVNYEIASTSDGEVKLSLSCNSSNGWTDLGEDFLKLVEDRCLKSYKYLGPGFSVVKLMKDFCQSFLELRDDAADKQERHINIASNLDSLRPNIRDVLGRSSDPLDSRLYTNETLPQIPKLLALNGPGCPSGINSRSHGNLTCENSKKRKLESPLMLNSLVPIDDFRPAHDVNDISKGEERVRISVVNDVNSEQYPPYFHYIPENTVYQNAYLNFSLARGGDEDCCSCFADCLSSSIPCTCARETGGEFAYTLDGLIKKEFLDEAISMIREPHNHKLFYCKDCPLEKTKNENNPGPCKGHLVRKFIKECWRKCGCHKQCGNRVVQRGITCNLQVFFTSEGKGWGLRTLEELPRGSFVCEYVGEVLTNTEFRNRNMKKCRNDRHTYPVLLGADWGPEGPIRDDEALCLDGTDYGNVARFINHRCFDANLVEIPVEVEVPDHNYYHIAFFTTRNVEALEELTWDYGIDFDDHEFPLKDFKCLCGSRLCRGVKHANRAKSGVLTLNGKHHL